MGYPIGRQPVRAGYHQALRIPGSINITHKEYTYNNYGGGFLPFYGLGSIDYSMSSAEKWGIGLGIAGGILGAVGAIWGNNDDGKGNVESPDDNSQLSAFEERLNQMQENLDEILAQNKNLKEQIAAINNLKAQSEEYQKTQAKQHTGEVKEVPQDNDFITFNVKASKKDATHNEGHTGYNIVATMYKSPDGKPLTSTEIKAICNEIFEGKALKGGEMQMPKEVTVNGKTYTWDESVENPEEKVPLSTFELSQHDVYKSEVKPVGSKWAVMIDGEQVGGLHDTKDAAEQAKEDKLAELNKNGGES